MLDPLITNNPATATDTVTNIITNTVTDTVADTVTKPKAIAITKTKTISKTGYNTNIHAITNTKLTLKQALFIDKYLLYKGNATKAVKEIYDTNDYATASAIGYENLCKPYILEAIKDKLSAPLKADDLKASWIIEELISLARKSTRQADRIKSLELLGKFLALWKDKSIITDSRKDDKTAEELTEEFRSFLAKDNEQSKAGRESD